MVFQKIKNKFNTLNICFSRNNTIASLTNSEKNVILTLSTGHLGYRGSKKGTQSASQHLIYSMGKELLKLGYSSVHLKIRGLGRGRNSTVKDLLKVGISIKRVFDHTSIPFNGCRVYKSKK